MESNVIQHTILLLFSFSVFIPMAIFTLGSNEKFQQFGIMLSMFLLIVSPQLGLNYLADHEYVKGTSQAYEITILDFFAIIYFFILQRKKDYAFKLWMPGIGFFFFYVVMCSLSFVNAPNFSYAAFELFKILKTGFFMVVFYNIFVYYNCYSTVIRAFSFGLLLNFGFIFFQRYILGNYAVIGLMKHKNSAGMFINMLMPIYLYMILNLDFKNSKNKIYYTLIFFICVASVIFTISRGAWAILALNIGMVMLFSLLQGMTRQKIMVLSATLLVLVLGLIKSYSTIHERFSVGNEAGTEGRKSLVINAADMANKNFFGVGLNNYTEANTFANNYGNIFEELNYDEDGKIGKVETVYMLTAGEIGWLGLLSLLMWYFYYLWQAFSCTRYYWKSNMAYLAIGLFISLFGAFLHSMLEWTLRFSQNFYLLVVVFALVASLVHFKKPRKARGRRTPARR